MLPNTFSLPIAVCVSGKDHTPLRAALHAAGKKTDVFRPRLSQSQPSLLLKAARKGMAPLIAPQQIDEINQILTRIWFTENRLESAKESIKPWT
nr:hypothetical protein [uncultured Cohaesibacter sp.]